MMWPICTKENCGMHESRSERVFLQKTHNVQNTGQLEESYSRETNVCKLEVRFHGGKSNLLARRVKD